MSMIVTKPAADEEFGMSDWLRLIESLSPRNHASVLSIIDILPPEDAFNQLSDDELIDVTRRFASVLNRISTYGHLGGRIWGACAQIDMLNARFEGEILKLEPVLTMIARGPHSDNTRTSILAIFANIRFLVALIAPIVQALNQQSIAGQVIELLERDKII